jgi:hypothetical protein
LLAFLVSGQRSIHAFFAPIPAAPLRGRHSINLTDKRVRLRVPFPDHSITPECGGDIQWGCGFPLPAKHFQHLSSLAVKVNMRINPMRFHFMNHKYREIWRLDLIRAVNRKEDLEGSLLNKGFSNHFCLVSSEAAENQEDHPRIRSVGAAHAHREEIPSDVKK